MRACYVYRHYDADDNLLYVGVSRNPQNRIDTHRKTAHWFNDSVRVEHEKYSDRESAIHAETAAIKSESPKWNVINNPLPPDVEVVKRRVVKSKVRPVVPEGCRRLTANIRRDLHLKLKIEAAKRGITAGKLIEELIEKNCTQREQHDKHR